MKESLYQARAEVAKALAHATRLQIIDILAEGGHCVCELTELLGISQSSVSKHLGVLKKAGVVDSEKDGLNVNYSLRIPCVSGFFGCIDRVLAADLKRREEELKAVRGENHG
ncbi:MAG: metalloregulator ArsR/SmtB family transcription factor [Halanaerobium sp.]|nr:metalloregulator ArsR/SmtB family transcription factor [Halanaerobium sp.]